MIIETSKETQTQIQNTEVVQPSWLQVTLRKALLHKAVVETKNKFTGVGSDNNHILRQDAEDIVATCMAILQAKRNNSVIQLEDGLFFVNQYITIGSGMKEAMNWNGESYYSIDIDDENKERSLVKGTFPAYVQDEDTILVNGEARKVQAKGKVVSPTRFQTLVKSYNGLQAKVDKSCEIAIGQNVDKSPISFNQWQYLYFKDEVRQVAKEGGEGTTGYGSLFATFCKPTVQFDFVFGKPSEAEQGVNVWEWLW